jgi:general L-amino acid transport system permease protein
MVDRPISAAYVRGELAGPMPPPQAAEGAALWLRARLFNGPLNSALTVLGLASIAALLWPSLKFLLIDAVWHGTGRNDCLPEAVGHEVGACWPFIAAKLNQFMYGFYPRDQQWRV